jgi:altronate hydrolase
MPSPARSNAVIQHEDDNVAIVVRPLQAGDAILVNGEELVTAAEDVDVGHKVALRSIDGGGTVYRYGEPIIQATEAIAPGAWVHVHNTQPIPGDVQE